MRWPRRGESMYAYARYMEALLIARGWVAPKDSAASEEGTAE